MRPSSPRRTGGADSGAGQGVAGGPRASVQGERPAPSSRRSWRRVRLTERPTRAGSPIGFAASADQVLEGRGYRVSLPIEVARILSGAKSIDSPAMEFPSESSRCVPSSPVPCTDPSYSVNQSLQRHVEDLEALRRVNPRLSATRFLRSGRCGGRASHSNCHAGHDSSAWADPGAAVRPWEPG